MTSGSKYAQTSKSLLFGSGKEHGGGKPSVAGQKNRPLRALNVPLRCMTS